MSEALIVLSMFAVLLLLLFMRLPVAFALAVTGLIYAALFLPRGMFGVAFEQLFSVMNSWVYAAIPLFVFMGAILDKAGFAKELTDSIHKLVGGLPGSLAITAVLTGYVFGAMSGILAVAITVCSFLLLPAMIERGYNDKVAIGSIVAGGSLPQIIPPSLIMIIYGTVVGVSVSKLFAGGLGVGSAMTVFYIIFIIVYSYYDMKKKGITRKEKVTLKERIEAIKYLIGPFVIIFGVLGGIFLGVATPTEASGVGAFLSLLYALARRKLDMNKLKDALVVTLNISVMCMWLIYGGKVFSAVFSALGGTCVIRDMLLHLPGGRTVVLLVAVLLLVVLGMFMEPVGIIMVVGPVLNPVMRTFGYDPVWWGVIFCSWLVTAYITPPVGNSLYIFKSTVDNMKLNISLEQIYRAAIPFAVIQILALIICTFMLPQIPTWFINLLS